MRNHPGITGERDEPIHARGEDMLQIQNQIDGFAEFIKTCDTPMTVSIQGSWGSGKTSFFNAVRDSILHPTKAEPNPENTYVFVSFNSWQFSQFNAGAQLAPNLFASVIRQLKTGMNSDTETSKVTAKTEETIKTLAKMTGAISFSLLNNFVANRFGVDARKVIEDVKSSGKTIRDAMEEIEKEPDAIEVFTSLRNDFQICIKNRLGIKDESAAGNKRLIIFVDDLDRLPPDRAVELLEALKIFLDCRYCVFVLAIDYSVVVNGVSMKYKGSISAGKGNEFFEKLIQVVYKMPESIEHSEAFITRILRKYSIPALVSGDFSMLIKDAGKDNPRAVKRLINTFLLLRKIEERSHSENAADIAEGSHSEISGDQDAALFAFICLRETCEELYNAFLSHCIEMRAFLEKMTILKDEMIYGSSDEGASAKEDLREWGLICKEEEFDRKRRFLQTFFKVLIVCGNLEVLGEEPYYREYALAQKPYSTLIHDALLLSDATGVSRETISSLDTVSLIIVELKNDAEPVEIWDGTPENAYAATLWSILEEESSEALYAAIEPYEFLSAEKDEAHPLSVPVRLLPGDGYAPWYSAQKYEDWIEKDKAHTAPLYSSTASAQTYADRIDTIARDRGLAVRWLKGRLGQTLCVMGKDEDADDGAQDESCDADWWDAGEMDDLAPDDTNSVQE